MRRPLHAEQHGPVRSGTVEPRERMTAGEFIDRFGGACRTNDLLLLPRGRRELARFVLDALRGRLATVNRRAWAPQGTGGLPRELIRLHPWEAEYLFVVAGRARRGIVEIGRLAGGSTFLLACANPDVPIWSVDVAPRDDGALRRLLDEHGVGRNVELLVADSTRGVPDAVGAFDVLFVDGDHDYGACRSDLETYVPRLVPGGHALVHDCYGGNQVAEAVLDAVDRMDVEVVRSPFNVSSHWYAPYGSLAHLRTPVRVERSPAPPAPARRGARVERRAAALVAAAVLLFGVFGAAPELLGDWPYNAFGKNARAHVLHHRTRALPHPARPA